MKIKEILYNAYADLGMAVYSIKEGEKDYTPIGYGIRKKTYKGLMEGKSEIRSIFRDERIKLTMPECCWYCGGKKDLTLDHLIPKKRGGTDSGDNFVYACRTCNSSKGATDLMTWYRNKGEFPPLYVYQRYLKLIIRYCIEKGVMEEEMENISNRKEIEIPFDLESIPQTKEIPKPENLKLFVSEKKEEKETFKGRKLVFTGGLEGISRAEAMEIAEKLGAETRKKVSGNVTHLIVGQELWEEIKKGRKTTNKIEEAKRLQEVEHPIQIWSEVKFLTEVVKGMKWKI